MSLISSIRSIFPSLAPSKAAQQPAEIELSAPPYANAGPPPGGIRTYSHHVTSALALLRGDTEPPLADLLCSDAASDRRTGLLKLEALMAGAGPVSVLDGHGSASETLRQLHQQACVDRLPPREALRESLRTVVGQLDAMMVDSVPDEPRQAAAAIKAVLGGKGGKTTAELLNSFRSDDRLAGNAKLDELLQHLQALSSLHGRPDPGEMSDDNTPSALPDALAEELRHLILSAGHAVLPERRAKLLNCQHLGLPFDSWLEKCDALAKSASDAMTALRTKPAPAAGQPGREYPPPSGDSLAKIARTAKAARELAVTAAPHANRSTQSANYRVALRGPFAALVREMRPDEAAELYRRLKQPECVAMRDLAVRALSSRQPVDEGCSTQATRLAAERQQLEDWLAAYDMLLEMLHEYTGEAPEVPRAESAQGEPAQPQPVAGGDVSAQQNVRAKEMFMATFGFNVDAAPERAAVP
ncbi:hypothetical protein L602_000400000060 [Cupriavidus gilardii J11]|uniref:Uncharacterized protein n=1 Tax=Cupriavidus gilardii J11 TaxID=936133 RepID=A0A562B928_9BURK|nr:hypothetical protein [Cupriavidus gilardii]TWG81687.1 hypothetical protein L602_000400000060 [Cupriavidus gilardii J11]